VQSLPTILRSASQPPAYAPRCPRQDVHSTAHALSTIPHYVDEIRNCCCRTGFTIHIGCTSRVSAEEKSALAPLSGVPRLPAWSVGGRIGTGCLDHAPLDQSEREFRGERRLSRARCSTIRVAMPSRTGEASRVASSTPTWRLGVPCEGSVRDPIRLAALALANHVARPGDMGMEAGALVRPTADGSVQRRRREEEQRESIP
jgi:hypothetical protein